MFNKKTKRKIVYFLYKIKKKELWIIKKYKKYKK